MKHSRRRIGQRARRDAENEGDPRAGVGLPVHGEIVGHIEYELHGQRVRATLLGTGKHCRSYGVEIDGAVVGVMGSDRAWSEFVRPAVRPMMSLRSVS